MSAHHGAREDLGGADMRVWTMVVSFCPTLSKLFKVTAGSRAVLAPGCDVPRLPIGKDVSLMRASVDELGCDMLTGGTLDGGAAAPWRIAAYCAVACGYGGIGGGAAYEVWCRDPDIGVSRD